MRESIDAVLQVKPQPFPIDEPEVVASPDAPVASGTMELEMMDLHLNLESQLQEGTKKVVQFVCSQHGEGVSTITREYAWLVADRHGHRVLILDACMGQGGQKAFYGIENQTGWDQAVLNLVPLDAAVTRVAGNLYVSGYSASFRPPGVNKPQVAEFFRTLRESFDLVVIDSPPATTSGAMNFKPWIDGVVLVVEAEKTRWPVVENAKNRILGNGNRILGMVINKRRNYIPEFIYRRL